MDRISKALELARTRRRGGSLRLAPAEELPAFAYTQTRHVQLSRDALIRARILTSLDDERLVDAYRLLRTRVLHRMEKNKWRTLGITSAAPKEGKSLTAINLAISIAMELHYTVLLVDADLRRPMLHNYLGFRPERGLSDYLIGDIPVEEVLVHPGIERLVLFPGNGRSGASPEHLSGEKMARLVEELRARYPERLVLFDLPPVLLGDDVVAFSPHLDALLLVVEDSKTQSDELGRAVELLENVNVIGTVLNKSSAASSTYDYYY